MTTNAGKLSGHENNFNLIRCLAATAVIVSHSWPIALGAGTAEPLDRYLGFSVGKLAVYIFFVISGFLVSLSFARQPRVFDFAVARVLRIAPALIVVLLLTVLVLGPVVTVLDLESYWTDKKTLAYFLRNLSLASLQYDLPGVFTENPYGMAINGSLWTLVHEVMCYFIVLLAGVFGALQSRKSFALVSVLYLVAYAFHDRVLPETGAYFHLRRLMDLGFAFWLGMCAFMFRDRFRYRFIYAAGLWCLVAIAAGFAEALFHPVLLVAVAYSTLWLAYTRNNFLLSYNRLGDYSYGLYIYAFPVQQSIVHFTEIRDPVVLATTAFLLTLPFAVASWKLVEQPVLVRKKQIALGLRNWVGLPAKAV